MEDMEVRGRCSMQFESDLIKVKDHSPNAAHKSRHHKLSFGLPSIPQEAKTIETLSSSQSLSLDERSDPNLITISGLKNTKRKEIKRLSRGLECRSSYL